MAIDSLVLKKETGIPRKLPPTGKVAISLDDGGLLVGTDSNGDPVALVTAGAGDMVLAATQVVTGLKTFNHGKFKIRNIADTFSVSFSSAATAARTYILPDTDITINSVADISGLGTGVLASSLVRSEMATTVSSASLLTLTATSAKKVCITGSSNQEIKLPVTTTLVDGWPTKFINNSSSYLTIYTSDGVTVVTKVMPKQSLTLTCLSNAASVLASAWFISELYPPTDVHLKIGTESIALASNTYRVLAFSTFVGTMSPFWSSNNTLTIPCDGVLEIGATMDMVNMCDLGSNQAYFELAYELNGSGTKENFINGYLAISPDNYSVDSLVSSFLRLNVTAGQTYKIWARFNNGGDDTSLDSETCSVIFRFKQTQP